MSRRRRAEKRERIPDPRYGSSLVSMLVNIIMIQGKKGTAQRIVYGALEKVSEKVGKGDPVDLLLVSVGTFMHCILIKLIIDKN